LLTLLSADRVEEKDISGDLPFKKGGAIYIAPGLCLNQKKLKIL